METTMDRRTFLALAGSTALALAGCGSKQEGETEFTESTSTTAEEGEGGATLPARTIVNGVLMAPYDNGYGEGTHHATIEAQDYGFIKLELNAGAAPITVSNFCELATHGFYDGLTFHRVMNGFMIQGGDPQGNGFGGSDVCIKGEFSANGVANVLQHKRGVISMARATPYDSASSQFFIMHQDASYLDGQYAAFGRVVEGIDVVDAIAGQTPVEDDNGTVAPENQPVIVAITIED